MRKLKLKVSKVARWVSGWTAIGTQVSQASSGCSLTLPYPSFKKQAALDSRPDPATEVLCDVGARSLITLLWFL